MPQIINTNIASLNAQRNLNKNQAANDVALQRLSSGLRINSAKDDAAGLAISTRFESQIRGTNVAVRNAGDAISLAQTAEGALNSITTNLQRVRELAVQSANDTNSKVDRVALQQEVDQLIQEIDKVSKQTNFNGKKLLDGSFEKATFQTGANVGETISFGIGKVGVDTLGKAQNDGISSIQTSGANALVAGDLVINGFAVGASQGVDDTLSSGDKAESAIAKAAAINRISEQTGVTALVNANSVAGGEISASDTAGNFNINGVEITASVNANLSTKANLEAVASAINEKSAQTGVRAEIASDPSQGITLIADDGRNIIIEDGATASDFGIGAAETYTGTFTLVSKDGSGISLDSTTGDISANAGLQVGTFSGGNSGVVGNAATGNLTSGDLVINGVSVGATFDSQDTASSANNDQSAIAIAAAINAVSDKSGVTAAANENVVQGGTIGDGDGKSANITVNGIAVNVSTANGATVAEAQAAVVNAFNSVSGQTGVRAEAFGADSFRLIAEDGRNIIMEGAGGEDADLGLEDGEHFGSVTLQSAGKIELTTLTGNIDNAGFAVGSYGGVESGTTLGNLDISTIAGAETAIKAVDNALATISSKASELGAIQNRFDLTVQNLQATAENLSAANSRIRYADFAAETAALSRSQVLQQAGISVLAQANARPQQVLSLLQ